MRTIFKYKLNLEISEINMPQHAKVLSFQFQNGTPYIWTEVETDNNTEIRHFRVTGTGQYLPPECHTYIGTFQDGPFVCHLHEYGNKK